MGKVFCSSDWHGVGAVADKVLEFLKEDDTLYFLGDAIDRGSQGIEILTKLLADPRVKFIKGNHEMFMQECLPATIKSLKEFGDIFSYEKIYDDWVHNGGSDTIHGLFKLTIEEIEGIAKKLAQMPYQLIYDSPNGHKIIMEHSGYTPFELPRRSHDPLWDRNHFNDNWGGDWGRSIGDPEKTYVVHGHTPVQYLKFYYGYKDQPPLTKEEMLTKRTFLYSDDIYNLPKPKIIRYCGNHKIDLDMCTIVSNRIALLDLDTFEEIYFDKEG